MSILLVEDSPGDVRLTQEVLGQSRVATSLRVSRDGEEALRYLKSAVSDPMQRVPDLILLDLNLPRMDGREFLAEIKQDATLCHIPVVVLTTSQAEQDIQRAYELHANCYISKPTDFDGFIRVLGALEEFWFGVAQLPRAPAPGR